MASPATGADNGSAHGNSSEGNDMGKKKEKLHGRAFYESLGSPKFVVAPMVDQSEFAWRMLTRSFMTPDENSKLLAYTPMFHARLFEETTKYRDTHFQATRPVPDARKKGKSPGPDSQKVEADAAPFLDGNPAFDRPLFVQFCANEPSHLLEAAKLAAPYCDAVDLNLGCPQGIARKGHYGAFLQEDQDLIFNLINILHKNLPIPVTAKIRVLETKEKTLAYAQNVLAAGASIITVHGRRREQKGHLTGVADWSFIRYLRENLPQETVIFANGNILQPGDVAKCLEATGADAVMSAEGNLSDPAIFAQVPAEGQCEREYWRGRDGKGGWRVDAVFRRYMDIIHKHALQQSPPSRRPLFVVGDDESWKQTNAEATQEEDEEVEGPPKKKQKKGKGPARCFDPNLLAMRPHLFHLLRHFVSKHIDIRDALAKTRPGNVLGFENVLGMVERRVAEGLIEYERTDGRSWEEEMEADMAKLKASFASNNNKAPNGTSEEKTQEVKSEGAREEGNGVQVEEEEEEEEEFDPESSVATVKLCKRPWWVVQPIVRPLPKDALAKGALSLSKKDRKKLEAEAGESGNATHKKPVEDEIPKLDGKASAPPNEEGLVCG